MNEFLIKGATIAAGAFGWGFFCLLGASTAIGLLKGLGELIN